MFMPTFAYASHESWPEMVDLLKHQGIRNDTIYRHGLLLFAYLEKDDGAPGATGEAAACGGTIGASHPNLTRSPAGTHGAP
ncbi:MAG: L-rhamnose mutarotase [Devosia sp.]